MIVYDAVAVAQQEPPRLLAQRSEYGYTSQDFLAVPHEPEAVSSEEQQAISVRARTAFADQRELEVRQRDRRMWSERLRKAEQRADAKGIDIYKDEIGVRRHIMSMERSIDEAA